MKFIDPKKVGQSNLILVSAISPTPAGEGKTTMSIGLTEGLNRLGKKAKQIDMPIGTPDIMPTLLGLSGLNIPKGVEGTDYSSVLDGSRRAPDDVALIECPWPFGEWKRKDGGKENRGIRTKRYTYVRDLEGPWLLYDNQKDPYQQTNLTNDPKHAALQADLDKKLYAKLNAHGDKFEHGSIYIKKWNYQSHRHGTMPHK